jgi:hypothetical protein
MIIASALLTVGFHSLLTDSLHGYSRCGISLMTTGIAVWAMTLTLG